MQYRIFPSKLRQLILAVLHSERGITDALQRSTFLFFRLLPKTTDLMTLTADRSITVPPILKVTIQH